MLRVATCWDDGVVDDIRLIALCREYDVPATFNLNAGLLNDERTAFWEDRGKPVIRLARAEVRGVYEGMDVANHGFQHLRLDEERPLVQREEVERGRTELEALLGRSTPGYCYAYGAHDATAREAVRAAGHVYGRTAGHCDSILPVADPMWLDPSRHYLDEDLWDEYEVQRELGGAFYLWGHAYELRDEADWTSLEAIFDRITNDPDAEWVRVVDLLEPPDGGRPPTQVDGVVAELRTLGPSAAYDLVPVKARAAVTALEGRAGAGATGELLHAVRAEVCAERPRHLGVTVPDEALAELDAELARIRSDDERPEGFDEYLLRDLAYGLGRLVPLRLFDVQPTSSPTAQICPQPCLQWHLSVRRTDTWGRAGWWDAFLRIAEMVAENDHLGGAFAASWLHDPALAWISPHLAPLNQDLLAAGAELHEVPIDAATIETSLLRSSRRRELYARGEYVPRKFLVFWPRDALIRATPPADLR